MFFQGNEKYNCATYLRLSRSDGDQQESNSIKNQRALLNDYMGKHPELHKVDEYVDDGYSGTNFERPAFQNLFRELEQGTINCILVKDLSRFGRNYIEVGRYLERIFPVMRVRLIAVTDNYDSQSAWKTSDSIMVPMRNLLNDAYRVQEDERMEQIQRLRTEKDQIFQPVKKDTDSLQAVMNTVGEVGDVMHLSQNVVGTFIDRIEVFNDERVKIRFTFEDTLKSYETG